MPSKGWCTKMTDRSLISPSEAQHGSRSTDCRTVGCITRRIHAPAGVLAHPGRRGARPGVDGMMQTSVASAAMRRVEQIAQEYRDKGYDVLIEPEAPQLPGSL